MKCVNCGEGTMEIRHEPRRGFSGLPDVTIDDVEVRNCPVCGETEVSYDRIQELTATVAKGLAERPRQLTPQEVRFLRTYLGLSTDDLARRMGVTRDSITRWERTTGDPTPMGATAERLLRLMALGEKPTTDYSSEFLDSVADPKAKFGGFRIVPSKRGGWKVQDTKHESATPSARHTPAGPKKRVAKA